MLDQSGLMNNKIKQLTFVMSHFNEMDVRVDWELLVKDSMLSLLAPMMESEHLHQTLENGNPNILKESITNMLIDNLIITIWESWKYGLYLS